MRKQRTRQTYFVPYLLATLTWVGILSFWANPAAKQALAQDLNATATELVRMQQEIFATQTAKAKLSATAGATRTTMLGATPSPTRAVRATRTPAPTPTVRPTSTPAPNAGVLAPKLNIRSGPGIQYEVIGLATANERYFVMGQANNCAWLQIVLENGTEGWIVGDATLTQTNVPCTAIRSAEVAAVPQPPTATPLAAAATRASQPTATRAAATNTPASVTPLPAPTRNLAAVGPSSVAVLAPPDGYSSLVPVTFSWTPDAPLAPGQEFEVVFWNAAAETEAQGRGWVRSGLETSVRIDPSRQPAGAYRWGIFIVATNPYQRLRYLGPGYTLTVPNEGSGGGVSSDGGGGGGSGGSPPDASGGGGKP